MKVSIIICTHNPNQHSFQLLLNRLVELESSAHEIIIIDNMSSPSLEAMIEEHNSKNRIMINYYFENRLGLSFARQTGIKRATGDLIVFFDDDNLPETDYITNVVSVFREHNQIGIIGPGQVDVIFFDNTGKTITQKHPIINRLFQEKHINNIEYSNTIKCTAAFPEGTGFAMRKAIADAYAKNVENYQTTGRKGKSLASGDDFQLTYKCLKLNMAAGRSPKLRLKHLIPISKTKIAYIRRLKFGQTFSVPLALQESFPEIKSKNIIVANGLTNASFLFGIVRELLTPSIITDRVARNLSLAHKCGWYYGYHLAAGNKTPIAVSLCIRLFKLN